MHDWDDTLAEIAGYVEAGSGGVKVYVLGWVHQEYDDSGHDIRVQGIYPTYVAARAAMMAGGNGDQIIEAELFEEGSGKPAE